MLGPDGLISDRDDRNTHPNSTHERDMDPFPRVENNASHRSSLRSAPARNGAVGCLTTNIKPYKDANKIMKLVLLRQRQRLTGDTVDTVEEEQDEVYHMDDEIQLILAGGARPLKSCMKVSTVEESLRSCKSDIRSKIRRRMSGGSTSSSRRPSASRRTSWCSIRSISYHSDHQSRASSRDAEGPLPCVGFDRLEVREYEMILSDNPAVTNGPAVGRGWQYTVSEPVSVDAYESNRGKRRVLLELKLTEQEREARLRESGYCGNEIRESMESCRRAKAKRAKTLRRLKKKGIEKYIDVALSKVKLIKKIKLAKSKPRDKVETWTQSHRVGRQESKQWWCRGTSTVVADPLAIQCHDANSKVLPFRLQGHESSPQMVMAPLEDQLMSSPSA